MQGGGQYQNLSTANTYTIPHYEKIFDEIAYHMVANQKLVEKQMNIRRAMHLRLKAEEFGSPTNRMNPLTDMLDDTRDFLRTSSNRRKRSVYTKSYVQPTERHSSVMTEMHQNHTHLLKSSDKSQIATDESNQFNSQHSDFCQAVEDTMIKDDVQAFMDLKVNV